MWRFFVTLYLQTRLIHSHHRTGITLNPTLKYQHINKLVCIGSKLIFAKKYVASISDKEQWEEIKESNTKTTLLVPSCCKNI